SGIRSNRLPRPRVPAGRPLLYPGRSTVSDQARTGLPRTEANATCTGRGDALSAALRRRLGHHRGDADSAMLTAQRHLDRFALDGHVVAGREAVTLAHQAVELAIRGP